VKLSVHPGAIRAIRWQQYALRFALGGLVTVFTGLIARGFGPVVGGLFLAFPAIFPATATLLASREREKKQSKGLDGRRRARAAAALDAIGTALGAIGLLSFAVIVWRELAQRRPAAVLMGATLSWLGLSVALWWMQSRHWFRRRAM